MRTVSVRYHTSCILIGLIVTAALGQAEVDELREEYSNARNFYDGDIYRHLRRATLVGNLDARKRWLSKLKDTKGRDVCSLEKRAERDPQTRHLQSSLDGLLPFPGLWPALRIGTFHRLLSLRCPEASRLNPHERSALSQFPRK